MTNVFRAYGTATLTSLFPNFYIFIINLGYSQTVKSEVQSKYDGGTNMLIRSCWEVIMELLEAT